MELTIKFNKDEQEEILKTAGRAEMPVADLLNRLAGLYRANLYEDLKDIEKGE